MTSIGDSDLNSVDSSVFSMLLKYVVTNKKKTPQHPMSLTILISKILFTVTLISDEGWFIT